MYVPDHFREEDRARILGIIESYPFALLISQLDAQPFATHLPLLLQAGADGTSQIFGHLARANPQCGALHDGLPLLAIFSGPHAYVSPTWYARPGVATWNYAAVHVVGRARVIEAEDEKLALVDTLTERFDGDTEPGDGPGLDEPGRRRMLGGIVAFELCIERIEAKFKLSQNRTPEDRQRVIAHLGQQEHPDAQVLAGLMLEDLTRSGESG